MYPEEDGPWPDVATARLFLAALAGIVSAAGNHQLAVEMDKPAVAQWLIQQGLGPLAFSRCRHDYPELARHLQVDRYTAAAQSTLYFADLAQIEATFQSAGLPLVLLKGAALAQAAYGDVALRTMSDVDIWVCAQDMLRAAGIMQELGFRAYDGREDRPLELQMLSQGEIQFYGKHWGLVELHWSPFPGWWLARTAVTDDTAVWKRIEPIAPDRNAYQLAAEDMVIQIAVHQAVNHQMGMYAVRGLIDIALTDRSRMVDWKIVAERAKKWRVGTAVWLVLSLLDQLIGAPGLEPALAQLRPSRWRQKLLKQLVSPESVLAGQDLREGRTRFLLLLLLVDRWRDMVYLIFRTLWPENAWLQARHGKPGNHWRHLWQVVRYGRV